MKILLFTAAIAAALGAAACACPVAHIRNNTGVPKRDVHASTSASMTVRWNTAPASTAVVKAARTRLAPALPPLRTVI